MTARIYVPAKTAMQSGKAKTHNWVVDYEPEVPRQVEPMMGYTSSSDMHQQVRMNFASKDEAIAFCERNGIAYRVQEPKVHVVRRSSYSDNFRAGRTESWTH